MKLCFFFDPLHQPSGLRWFRVAHLPSTPFSPSSSPSGEGLPLPGLWSSDQEKVFTFTFFGCTSGSTLWLGPHDRIMRLWIHGGCTMNPQPHDPIMRLWIHGTQGIGPGTRHWPRTASPHGPIMRGDGPASPQCCTVLYCTGSWIKDQGSRIKDQGPWTLFWHE